MNSVSTRKFIIVTKVEKNNKNTVATKKFIITTNAKENYIRMLRHRKVCRDIMKN